MEKRVKSENEGKYTFVIKIFAALFSGFLLSIMATMMYIGGGINFEDFLNTGDVYDFPQETLKVSSRGWLYDGASQGYFLQNNHALKKYMLNGQEKGWEYLYLNVAKMSLPEVQTSIIYYNKENQQVWEQPFALHEGENIIILQGDIAMYRMGVRIMDAKGQFVSIQSVQMREKASGYTNRRFAKIFGTAFGGFLVVFCLFLVFGRKFVVKWRVKQRIEGFYVSFVEIQQYIYQVFFGKTGERISAKLGEKSKSSLRVFLFSLLFFWMVLGNVLNWCDSQGYYRYHVAVCLVLLFFIGTVSWEISGKQNMWRNPLAISWICLWTGMVISDFFVKKDMGMIGLAMLFGGGYFLFTWGNMEKREEIMYNMLEALEKTFWVSVAYCMLFREKKLGIYYNGIFRSPEEFSMYAALLLSVFLIRIDMDIRKSVKGEDFLKKYIMHISGGAVAFYFILRSGNIVGNITALILIGLFLKRQIFLLSIPSKEIFRILACFLKGSVLAFLLVCIVHTSTKILPAFFELNVIYEKDKQITGLNDEMKEIFNEIEPGLMDGVRQKDEIETKVVQKNYIRKWNLFGNGKDKLRVFRAYAAPDNGYIYIAYKYGLFLLIPYVIFQICFLGKGARIYWNKKKVKEIDIDFLLLMIGIIFTGFCIYGNLEIVTFGHPLWLCYYLGAGYWFAERKKM